MVHGHLLGSTFVTGDENAMHLAIDTDKVLSTFGGIGCFRGGSCLVHGHDNGTGVGQWWGTSTNLVSSLDQQPQQKTKDIGFRACSLTIVQWQLLWRFFRWKNSTMSLWALAKNESSGSQMVVSVSTKILRPKGKLNCFLLLEHDGPENPFKSVTLGRSCGPCGNKRGSIN